jgi:hypothetical protein
MAVNFNVLRREGPMNLYEGFEQGQQAAAQNALAQQKMAQERDLMSMRRQEFQANLESTQADRRRKAVAEKTAMFRDRVLRAPTPQAARELVRLQHSDPDLGPVIQQFGSLDQDLADIPDDPTGFESWRQREAMGAAEFIKSQASERGFQALLARARGGQPPAAAPTPAPVGEVVAEPIAAPRGVMREIAPGGAVGAEAPLTRGEPAFVNTLAPAAAPTVNAMVGGGRTPAQIRAEIDVLNTDKFSNDPRVVREIQTLQKEYAAALRVDPSELRTMQALGYPLTQEGYASFRAAQMREQAPPALVPILQNGRPVLVPREQAVGQTPFSPTSVQVLGMGPQREAAGQKAPAGYRFTPSGDLEPIPGGPASPSLNPKDIQKREAAFPQATQAVSGFETKSEQFIKELERLRDDPGLNQITGPIFGRTPSVSREGSRAQALYDKIFAKGGFQALQDMREASKTGGALGNVSNEEGRRLEKSIVGGLDRTQNIADVQQGINDLIDEIRTSKSRVREAYDTTYEYRAQRGASGSAPAAKQMSPQDKQALDWANSNPKDPRAAQIKARLGVQ